MPVRRKVMRPRGNIHMELVRKGIHVLVGLVVVLLVQGEFLSAEILGLLTLLMAAVVAYNYQYERELLIKIISINRPDAKIPGMDLLAYMFGMWLSLVLFPQDIALAAILVVAFGDPLAHLVSRGFGGTKTMVSRDSYWYGYAAGTAVATLAAWIYVPFVSALLASAIAMFVEAGEFRIADHHIDDNFTIPLVAGAVLWVMAYAI